MNNSPELEEISGQELSEHIKERAQESSNEEELKIGFAILLDPFLRAWNIKPAYERYAGGVRCVVSGVRKDALYGTVIVEFKAPGKLKSEKEFSKAKEQVKRYIETEAVDPRYYGRYFGVVLDGYQISFVRFRKGEWEEQDEPLEINAYTVLRFLEAIRGLKRKPIDAQLLLEDFGPKSAISKDVILSLYKALANPKSPRTEMLFEDWERVFSQVCAYSKDKLKGLIGYYGLSGDIDVEKLMFAIHTYYTLLMKLLTSEIVTLFADSLIGSYLKRIEDAYMRGGDEMLLEMKELEEGGIFKELRIRNFLEADYFAWYIDEWDEEIAGLVYEMAKKLLDYEPATVELTPERVKDLFKRLYQNLVPREIRHKLGEYFTPDWLAELLLDEVGYDGNPEKRILDPACGSGTFLVMLINRIKEYADEHFVDKRTLITKIVNNVQGFDLNPLAVLASKANYLIALADFLRYRPKEGIEIPIYLADSIAVSRRAEVTGQWVVYMKTSAGEFSVPHEVIDKGLLSRILETIEDCVKRDYSSREFEKLIGEKFELRVESVDSLLELYEKISDLEKKGKNKIWTGLLKNSFAPLLVKKFDYVVGNPPWINWENLPEYYREQTRRLWDWYGLLKKTKGMGLGKVKRDMAMLFLARCLDRYTKDEGKLAFLIPFTVYKTQAGAGFREFLAKGYWQSEKTNSPCNVEKIHDLVTLYPFEGAVNRTSLIVVEKSWKTEFPVHCRMWHNPRSKGIGQEVELVEVEKTTKQFDLAFIPIKEKKPESPWMEITEKAHEGIKKVIGKSTWYKAHAGVVTLLNQVYWIEILSEEQNGLLITNPSLPGQKKKVKQVKKVVDKDLIFPLVRGRDVKKWYVKGDLGYILMPVNENGKTLSHSDLKVKHQKTYQYFSNFVEDLVNRGGEPYKTKLKPYREKPFEDAERVAPPFYWLFNAEPSLAPYKVVWKRISGAITGKAVHFASAVLEPGDVSYTDEKLPVILNDSLILLPLNNPEEAYYVAGVLNSSIVLMLIASYTYELRQETHITQYVKIPKYNPNNPLHQKLSELSKKAHEITREIYEEEREDLKEDLARVEEEIDKKVVELYGITENELKEIRKCLRILKEGEVEEEEGKEEEVVLPKEEKIEIELEPLLIKENESQEMEIKVANHLKTKIQNAVVKIMMEDNLLFKGEIAEIKSERTEILVFNSPKLRSGQYPLKVILEHENEGEEEIKTLFVRGKTEKRKSLFDEELEEMLK
jgi:hypothetical protein